MEQEKLNRGLELSLVRTEDVPAELRRIRPLLWLRIVLMIYDFWVSCP